MPDTRSIHRPAAKRAASAFGRARWWGAAFATALLVSACAELPKNVERPVSKALASPAGTPLADLVRQRHDAAGATTNSGFVLLAGPQSAYGSRLALVENARKTIDLQYYAIHADASTARLLVGVRDAARRGVRVRILLDDFHSTGRNALVMRLAYVPNIEMRMFNPVPGSRDSTVSRLVNSLGDASRIQQRMHNKLFIADNVLSVTGGRNLGDAYFGNAEAGNFVDLDVLAAGPIVQDLSRSFDAYWNNERAYPVQSLVTREELDRIQDEERVEQARAKPQGEPQGAPQPPDGEPRPAASDVPTPAQRARAWDQKPMDLTTADFVWAPAIVKADAPDKIPADGGSEPEVRATGDTVVDGLLQLLAQTRQDLLIISPYFVPGPDMKRAFAAARARGVRIRVLTNSLASNDAPVAHVGYARHREELLALGVDLYELRSEPTGLRNALGQSGASGGGLPGQSRAMLHSKVLVLDGRLLVVGSMNLDLRSQLQNTEIALLIRSGTLSKIADEQIEAVLRDRAWHVTRDEQGLLWQAPQGSGLANSRVEPDTSLGLRLLLKAIGPLAPDEML